MKSHSNSSSLVYSDSNTYKIITQIHTDRFRSCVLSISVPSTDGPRLGEAGSRGRKYGHNYWATCLRRHKYWIVLCFGCKCSCKNPVLVHRDNPGEPRLTWAVVKYHLRGFVSSVVTRSIDNNNINIDRLSILCVDCIFAYIHIDEKNAFKCRQRRDFFIRTSTCWKDKFGHNIFIYE